MHHLKAICLLSISAMLSAPLQAGVSIPHEFAAGEKAVAAEVNANFQALASALASALTKIEQLEAELATLKTSNAMALDEFVEVVPDPYVPGGTTVRFVGVNVQVVSGSGSTDGEVNGLGNLIVGYNEPTTSTTPYCSASYSVSEVVCEAIPGVWSAVHKTGSHNLIVGQQHNYTHSSGFVAGYRNTISGAGATVSGGRENTAVGSGSVSGGESNLASGSGSSVSGGHENSATSSYASVSGGRRNQAGGMMSSVVGGVFNTTTASASFSVVLGGAYQEAKDDTSIVPR